MKTTIQFKLNLTAYEERLLNTTLSTYIITVNDIVQRFLVDDGLRLSSKDVQSELPSALKNQCIKDAKTLLNKYKKISGIKPLTNWCCLNCNLRKHLQRYLLLMSCISILNLKDGAPQCL